MKKILSLVSLFCMTAVSAFAGIISVPDAEYTSLSELEGKTFAIVNKADGMALYGTNNQNLGYAAYADAFQVSNSGYMWKAVYDAEAEAYYLQLVTPSGADYNCWGMGGVLNSQGEPQGWACSFILGTNGAQKGQDIPNGALYNLTYTNDGWTIKNVGTGMYQPYSTKPANSTEATYWSFCSLKELDDGIAPETFEMPASVKSLIDNGTQFFLKSGDKYLIGGDQQAVVAATWEEVAAANNSSMWILTENEDGSGMFRAVTAEGANVSAWGANPCYLNCQPGVGGVLFKMNKDQDFKNGSSWIIAEGEGGYTLQCVGNKGYATIGCNTSAEPAIWQIIVISEEIEGNWDGTVTTSLDDAVITSLEDLNNMTITFNGAASISIVDEEECQYLMLQNEDGSEVYGFWAPTMGSEYTIDGNTITIDGFMAIEDFTMPIPAGTTKLYIEDYGVFAIDGEADYIETIELNANIAAGVEPFMLTAVRNNNVFGTVMGVEASEKGVSMAFALIANGKELSVGTAVPTLTLFEDAEADFGKATVMLCEDGNSDEIDVLFLDPKKDFFTAPGTYVLSIPEGTVVDAEGNPNAAIVVKFVVIENDVPTGINGISTLQNGKFVKDGKVIIVKNGKVYTTVGTIIKK